MNGIRARMLQILTVILAMMMIWRPAKAVPEMQKRVETPETGGIFADAAVVDLGNHRVAYLTESDDLESDFGYEKEIYYKDLDYYYIEERYESGEMISGTVMEEAPYWDEQSIWYWEGEENQELWRQKQ